MDGDIENAAEPNAEINEVGELKASKWYEKYKDLSVIDYSRFDANCWIKIDEANISDLPLLNNRSINDLIEPFCRDFDSIPQQDLFSNVTPLVSDFAAYLLQCNNQKCAASLVQCFPPVIGKLTPSVSSFTILLAKILHTVKDTRKFIYYITNALFQRFWTQKPCLINQYLVSICRCKMGEKDEPQYWAYIDRDRQFLLDQITPKGIVNKQKVQISKAYISSNKKEVNILDINQNTVCKFIPFDDDQIKLWELIYSRQKVPFPFYLTSGADFYPEIIYRSVYAFITANDSVFVQTLLKSDILDGKVWEGVVKAHIHAKKFVFLAESVWTFFFTDTFELTNESFETPNHFLLYARAVGRCFFQPYFDNFFNKVSAIVDFHDDLDLTDIQLADAKLCEKILFNFLKYIMQGAAYIPKEWSVIMSSLRMFLNARYNSQALTFLGLSAFFGRGIIVPFFKENVKFCKNITVQHPENLPIFGYLLSIPFCLNVYSGTTEKFSGYNRRLENHFFPRWWAFLNNISDYEEDFVSQSIDNKTLSYAIDCALRPTQNMTFCNLIHEVIATMADPNIKGNSVPGWNYAILLSRFFVHCYDLSEKTTKKKKVFVKTKPVKLPSLPTFKGGSSGGGGMRGMPVAPHVNFQSPNSMDGDITVGSFFIPRSIPNMNHMSLPDLPPSAKFNPIIYNDADMPPTSDSDADALTITPKAMQQAQAQKKKEKKGPNAQQVVNSMDIRRAGFTAPLPPSPTPKKSSAATGGLPPAPKKPIDDGSNTDTDDDMKEFLRTIGDDDDKTKTGTKKHGKMVPVDPSKLKPGQPQPKLYKKVKK